jgi:hypothetical protein
MHKPYLSIITPSRNDDYAGGIIPRLDYTTNILLEQLDSHKLDSEIILVDYNYDPNRPRLKEAIHLHQQTDYCTVKSIEVSPYYHKKYRYWEKLPVYVSVAVNIGHRRARGVFCVQKASDTIWSQDLVKTISQKQLREDRLYRCSRVDVDSDILKTKPKTISDIMGFCENNGLQIYDKSSDYGVGFPKLHTDACGDFELMSREVFHLIHGFYEEEDRIGSFYCDGVLLFCAYAAGAVEEFLAGSHCVYKITHGNMTDSRHKTVLRGFERLVSRLPIPGGFRNKLLNGYRGFFGDPPNSVRGIIFEPRSEYRKLVKRILDGKVSYVMSGDNWGLGSEDLPEFYIRKAKWE